MAPNLQDFLSQYGVGGSTATEGPAPLSFGYVAPPVVPQAGTFGQPGSFSRVTNPTYLEGDEWAEFQGLAPETTWQIQQKMVDAGLLTGEFHRGLWDRESAEAMSVAMAQANAMGVDYTTALDQLASAPQPAGGQRTARNVYLAPTYEEPTAEQLAHQVRGFVRERLGREPDDADMRTLTAVLDREHRQEFDRQVDAQRSQFNRADATADENTNVTQGSADPGGLDNPVASAFQEEFEALYANELDRNRLVEQGAENEQGFMASVLATDRAIGAI